MSEDRITRHPDGTVTLALKTPIAVEGSERSTLTFKRLKAKHLMRTDGLAGHTKQVTLIAALATIPVPAAQELDIDDYEAADGIVGDFLEPFLRRGDASRPKSDTSSTGDGATSGD